MATEFHTRVRDVVDAALRRRTSQRARFIAEIAGSESAVRREALSLLPHYVDVSRKPKKWLPGGSL